MRREIASKTERLQADVHYCHQCFNWVFGVEEWESHCLRHLQTLASKKCGTITYCHTLVRPGYCPFCLGEVAEPAGRRLESWCRDHALWKHIDLHLMGRSWPLVCPHPLCDTSLCTDKDLQFHFIDEHGLSRTRPTQYDDSAASLADLAKKARSKRKFADGGELSWAPPEEFSPSDPAKKVRGSLSTIAPSQLLHQDNTVQSSLLHTGIGAPSPVPITESALPWEGENIPVDLIPLDHSSATEISSPHHDGTTTCFRNFCVHLHRTV